MDYLEIFPEADLIEEESYHALLSNFADKYGEEFKKQTASTYHHHSYPGGLMEHSIEVAALNYLIGTHYALDVELLMTAGYLHDMGKIRDYTFTRPNKTKGRPVPKRPYIRSESSRVLGHLGLGIIMLGELREGTGLTDQQLQDLRHIIASHHGPMMMRWGSLVDPDTPEAHVTHLSDMISSRIGGKPGHPGVEDAFKEYHGIRDEEE